MFTEIDGIEPHAHRKQEYRQRTYVLHIFNVEVVTLFIIAAGGGIDVLLLSIFIVSLLVSSILLWFSLRSRAAEAEKGEKRNLQLFWTFSSFFLGNRVLQTFSQPPTVQKHALILNCFSESDQILSTI
jgi:hypothetical protein